ncbi:unnamed protein product [Ambrosiozyma monospora]|uniref:Unnamed protein product n=1 Tax=Ambrosiozyma monospora TaxID=43982 RepID=A0ACB5T8A5_AMBMO|nr:unnamed protein product [Ambrosiozyma monospora]
MPKNTWERIKLSKNYKKALSQVDEHLIYWNKFLIHKCKQRLTRLTQVAITERRLELREDERHYVGVKHKVKRREETRERKALAAARIEKAIEKELLERLKSGAYGDKPLNVDEKIWKKVLGKVEDQDEEEEEMESDEEVDILSEDEEDESDVGEVEYVEADEDDDELVDMEDLEKWLDASSDEEHDSDSDSDSDDEDEGDKSSKQKRRKRPRIEIEYEEEPMTNISTQTA